MSARYRSLDLTPVNDWSEVPEFASEAEEAEFWGTHSLGEALLDQMRPLDEVLRRPRRRRRRPVVLHLYGTSRQIRKQFTMGDLVGTPVIDAHIWQKAS